MDDQSLAALVICAIVLLGPIATTLSHSWVREDIKRIWLKRKLNRRR